MYQHSDLLNLPRLFVNLALSYNFTYICVKLEGFGIGLMG